MQLACCVVTAALAIASVARAGGLEYVGQGAQSLARGGAVAARAEDPMVLAHNPAGLAELRGSQFLFNLNLALMDACVDPAGYYGWGVYRGGRASRLPDPDSGEFVPLPLNEADTSGGTPVAAAEDYYTAAYDTVCLDQAWTPLPQIAWTRRLTQGLGIGFGLIFPPVQPSGRWGSEFGVIENAEGDLRPAATRYMLLGSNNVGIFPTLGAGYRIIDQLRIGAAFEWGIIGVDNYTMVGSVGGTTPANDLIAHVKAQDTFIPALTASVHAVPFDELDIVVAFRWQDDIKAEGDIDLTTGVFEPGLQPHENKDIPITSLVQHMPWKLRGGVRYASRLSPRVAGTGRDEADSSTPFVVHDPLQDERWDLELDVEYQANSVNDAQVLEYGAPSKLFFVPEDPMRMADSTDFPNPDDPDTVIVKNWQDQVSIRLGGTLNLLPGVVGASAGVHFETSGVDPAYMQVDFWPVARLGLHSGLLVRVAKSIDIVVAYAHIFQETVIVGAPAHERRDRIDAARIATGTVEQIDKTVGAMVDREGTAMMVLEERSQGTPNGEARLQQNLSRTGQNLPPYIINAGRYRSNFDIIALGVNLHF